MKYFVMREHWDFINRFHLSGWENQINPQWVCFEELHRIPQRNDLSVKEENGCPLPDIITAPFLLVSEMVYQVLKMYGEEPYYRDVVIVNEGNQRHSHYYLLLLRSGEEDKNIIEYGSMFYKNVAGKQEIIVNLDFAESILRRGAVGIWLQEITL